MYARFDMSCHDRCMCFGMIDATLIARCMLVCVCVCVCVSINNNIEYAFNEIKT